MKEMVIDLETRSDKDITKCGVYAYADSPFFKILLFSVSIDGGKVQLFDLANGDKLPIEILKALTDETVIKRSHNVNFERICLSKYLRTNYPQFFKSYSINEDTVGDYLDPHGWYCTMVHCRYLGLPSSLAEVGKVLKLEEQKMTEGKGLIRYFCIPYDTVNGIPLFHSRKDAPKKWELFKTYNIRDVETEMAIEEKIKNFPVPDNIWTEFFLDQEINDRGIRVDMDVVRNAIRIDEVTRENLTAEMQDLTALDNPNSVQQMKEWLAHHGLEVDSLGKKEVQELLKTAPQGLAKVLMLRQQLAKSSVRKYQAMQNAVCRDSRARGMFQFYGANRSGRFSGRLIQLQNLPQNHLDDLAEARQLVRSGNFNALAMRYDNIPDVLSQLIRTAFVPRDGYKFIVADFSAIEARVIAHIAGEKWRAEVFKNGGDIYCASASQMFHCKVEKHGENAHLRQKGKIAELALGYAGSVGALTSMGALEMGLTEEELKPLVDSWRNANPHIVRLWYDVDRCVKETVMKSIPVETHRLRFTYQSGMLFITLPSGRRLAYVKPKIGINRFGSESVTYEGTGTAKKWERIETFGAKIVENCIQAIARDILCYAMQTLSHCFIVATVHDEIIIECDKRMSVDEVCRQMGRTPPWISGLLLRADGYECEFYKKD